VARPPPSPWSPHEPVPRRARRPHQDRRGPGPLAHPWPLGPRSRRFRGRNAQEPQDMDGPGDVCRRRQRQPLPRPLRRHPARPRPALRRRGRRRGHPPPRRGHRPRQEARLRAPRRRPHHRAHPPPRPPRAPAAPRRHRRQDQAEAARPRPPRTPPPWRRELGLGCQRLARLPPPAAARAPPRHRPRPPHPQGQRQPAGPGPARIRGTRRTNRPRGVNAGTRVYG
jgi:hypothetical protein